MNGLSFQDNTVNGRQNKKLGICLLTVFFLSLLIYRLPYELNKSKPEGFNVLNLFNKLAVPPKKSFYVNFLTQ